MLTGSIIKIKRRLYLLKQSITYTIAIGYCNGYLHHLVISHVPDPTDNCYQTIKCSGASNPKPQTWEWELHETAYGGYGEKINVQWKSKGKGGWRRVSCCQKKTRTPPLHCHRSGKLGSLKSRQTLSPVCQRKRRKAMGFSPTTYRKLGQKFGLWEGNLVVAGSSILDGQVQQIKN